MNNRLSARFRTAIDKKRHCTEMQPSPMPLQVCTAIMSIPNMMHHLKFLPMFIPPRCTPFQCRDSTLSTCAGAIAAFAPIIALAWTHRQEPTTGFEAWSFRHRTQGWRCMVPRHDTRFGYSADAQFSPLLRAPHARRDSAFFKRASATHPHGSVIR